MNLRESVVNKLALIPEVDAVLSARNGNLFYLWAVINSADTDLRRKVYEREKCIIDEFPDLEFNFNVITRRDRDLSTLVNEPGVEIALQRRH